jgi:predicted dienelactone hydrolase
MSTLHDRAERGPYPVGVRTLEVSPPDRGGSIPVEVWYPAAGDLTGADVDPERQDTYDVLPGVITAQQAAVRDAPAAAQEGPVVAFSHGLSGHRRQSSFLTTHLASHGYVVVAPDHVGNTLADLVVSFATQDTDAIAAASVQSSFERPGDLVASIDAAIAAGDLPIAPDRVGVFGHSFGGWAALQVVAREPRIGAVVALAPGGGRIDDEVAALAADALDLEWGRSVPTLLISGALDNVIPIAGMHDLLGRIPGVTALVVLERADHYHFCDEAESQHEFIRSLGMAGLEKMLPIAELCSGADAERLTRALTLAHFDAHLRAEADAAEQVGAGLEKMVDGLGPEASVRRT